MAIGFKNLSSGGGRQLYEHLLVLNVNKKQNGPGTITEDRIQYRIVNDSSVDLTIEEVKEYIYTKYGTLSMGNYALLATPYNNIGVVTGINTYGTQDKWYVSYQDITFVNGVCETNSYSIFVNEGFIGIMSQGVFPL